MAKVEVVLRGFPGKTNRGALGFCNITLVRGDRTILFDTGHFSDRPLLVSELDKRGIGLGDIELVVLSHLHYDHCLNIDLFERAKIVVSEEELKYASSDEPRRLGDLFVPRAIMSLMEGREIVRVEDGMGLDEGVNVLKTPGHTPGSISLIVEDYNVKVALAGDAVKNAWEFKNGVPEMFYGSRSDALESIRKLRDVADMIVPGHDRCFLYEKGEGKVIFANDLDLQIFARMDLEGDRWNAFSISTTKSA